MCTTRWQTSTAYQTLLALRPDGDLTRAHLAWRTLVQQVSLACQHPARQRALANNVPTSMSDQGSNRNLRFPAVPRYAQCCISVVEFCRNPCPQTRLSLYGNMAAPYVRIHPTNGSRLELRTETEPPESEVPMSCGPPMRTGRDQGYRCHQGSPETARARSLDTQRAGPIRLICRTRLNTVNRRSLRISIGVIRIGWADLSRKTSSLQRRDSRYVRIPQVGMVFEELHPPFQEAAAPA